MRWTKKCDFSLRLFLLLTGAWVTGLTPGLLLKDGQSHPIYALHDFQSWQHSRLHYLDVKMAPSNVRVSFKGKGGKLEDEGDGRERLAIHSEQSMFV